MQELRWRFRAFAWSRKSCRTRYVSYVCRLDAGILTVFGPVFVCVAALAILDRLDAIDVDTLAWWLAERQLPNGGLNGRPEKLEDVILLTEFAYRSFS